MDEKSTKRHDERHKSNSEEEEGDDYLHYVSCSEDYDEPKPKQPARNKKLKREVWVDVDESDSEGSQERRQGNKGETPLRRVVACGILSHKGADSCNTKPRPSNIHNSEPESSGPPFPTLAQRRRRSPTPSPVNSQRGHGQRRSTPAPMSKTGQRGRAQAMIGGRRIRPGNGRADKGLLRNQYVSHSTANFFMLLFKPIIQRNSAPTNKPGSQVAHPTGANSHAGSMHDDDEQDFAETNPRQRRFKMADLPLSAQDVEKWTAFLVPFWIDYVFSMSENPWQPGDLVSPAQVLWDGVFEKNGHELAANGEPVYYLVNNWPPTFLLWFDLCP